MKIVYWTATLLICALMLVSAGGYLSGSDMMVKAFHQLGYPDYFRIMLGIAKVLGVLVLLAPGLRRLKEWAYAGFTFTFIAAIVSHIASGEGPKASAPAIALVVLMISYFTRPPKRR
jgi:hypothetical protein